MVRIRAGSTMAREEMMLGSKMTILYIFSVSVMTEAQLVSEPVPAVVVMASWGTVMGFLVVHIPLNSRMLWPSCASMMRTALAQSCELPPPTETTPSHLFSLNSLCAACASWSLGLEVTPL
jgi:hypothetical protein